MSSDANLLDGVMLKEPDVTDETAFVAFTTPIAAADSSQTSFLPSDLPWTASTHIVLR